MSRILVVDDELGIRRLVETVLARGGHEAVLAATAGEALAAGKRGGIDAAIVDLGLPDRDGLEVVAALCAGGGIPLIVLSARTDVSDKIAALDIGADDYLTKPFDGDELLARLRVVMRRSRATSIDGPVAYGPIIIDRARHSASCRGEPVKLTPREFALLARLVEAGGRVCTAAHLLEWVWGKAHLGDVEYLRVAIRALRLKIEADPTAPRLIVNEPGIGYRLGD